MEPSRAAPDDLHFTIDESIREPLTCRPAPPDVDGEAAAKHFEDGRDRAKYEAWLAGGRRHADNPAGGQFWLAFEVRDEYLRLHVLSQRKKAAELARERGIHAPPPPYGRLYVDEYEYGKNCYRKSRRSAHNWGAPARPTEDNLRAWAKRLIAQHRRVIADVDAQCPFPGVRREMRAVGCADVYLGKPVPHWPFWRLVASPWPVVFSRRTGDLRLIDGAKRLLAHGFAGHRSPGVLYEVREYHTWLEEFEDVCRLNAAPLAPKDILRARIALHLDPYYRKEAAWNSGHSRYHEPVYSSPSPCVGKRGGRKPVPSRRKRAERMAEIAGLSYPTFVRYAKELDRLRQAEIDAAGGPVADEVR